MDKIELIKFLENFKDKKILVIGDIILDKYIEGSVERISPEAPVPLIRTNKEYYKLGGAANVASNIVSLTGQATLIGHVGKEKDGLKIMELTNEKNIRFIPSHVEKTIIKTRIIAEGHHLLRIDDEDITQKRIDREILEREASRADIIIISDYAKGTITQETMEVLQPFNNKIIVDPKPKNKELYPGVFLIVPNKKEVISMGHHEIVHKAGKTLREEMGSNIIVKRANEGMSIFSDEIKDIPTYAKEVYDVTGAGDTVCATLSLAISSGANLEQATRLANYAAGIVVGKQGTATVTIEELKAEILEEQTKIKSVEEIKEIIEDKKAKGKKIVWTNGAFDLLHQGHIEYLKKAKELGDHLVVGINSDESVKRLKGPTRPIQPEEVRAKIIASLWFVDYVLIFQEDNVSRYLTMLKPHISAKGGDYSIETTKPEERKAIEENNIETAFLPFLEGFSTTNILNKIKNNH